jgi:hypothetical protein
MVADLLRGHSYLRRRRPASPVFLLNRQGSVRGRRSSRCRRSDPRDHLDPRDPFHPPSVGPAFFGSGIYDEGCADASDHPDRADHSPTNSGMGVATSWNVCQTAPGRIGCLGAVQQRKNRSVRHRRSPRCARSKSATIGVIAVEIRVRSSRPRTRRDACEVDRAQVSPSHFLTAAYGSSAPLANPMTRSMVLRRS